MEKNIAQVQVKVAEGQALVDALCANSSGRTFTAPDSRPTISVVERIGGQDTPGAHTVVIWNPRHEFVYFAPTGGSRSAHDESGARRGNADDLIRFNEQSRPWLTRELGAYLIQATPAPEPKDPALAGASDLIEVLAAHCNGGVFNAPDESSTIAVFQVSGQAQGSLEPVVTWTDKSGAEESRVYFLPRDSTPGTSVMELMGARPGSTEDLQAFTLRVLPWLEPRVEELAGGYLEKLADRTLA